MDPIKSLGFGTTLLGSVGKPETNNIFCLGLTVNKATPLPPYLPCWPYHAY